FRSPRQSAPYGPGLYAPYNNPVFGPHVFAGFGLGTGVSLNDNPIFNPSINPAFNPNLGPAEWNNSSLFTGNSAFAAPINNPYWSSPPIVSSNTFYGRARPGPNGAPALPPGPGVDAPLPQANPFVPWQPGNNPNLPQKFNMKQLLQD